MASKGSTNPPLGPAPKAVVEDAIIENLERGQQSAEGDREVRHEMIATAAYFIAEQRGFVPGHEQEDWYRAQAAIDRQLPRLQSQD